MEWECHECGHHHADLPARCEACGAAPEILLNLWRCQHCGQEEIPGTATECPGCRAPKELGIESRVDEGQRLSGSTALELARGDWRYCAYCDVQVPPVNEEGQPNEECPNCSGPLEDATRQAEVEEVSAEEGADYRTEAIRGQGPAAATPTPTSAAQPRAGRGKLLVVAGIALALMLGIYFIFFHSWDRRLTVASCSWQRTIEVERFGRVTEEAWRAQVPAGAYDQRCNRKIHHHDKIPAGTERYTDKVSDGRRCAAHGYKKKGGVSVKTCTRWETTYKEVTKTRTRYRKVPVFRQHCRYNIDKWHRGRELTLAGAAAQPPAWPDTSKLVQGKERPGKRTEKYNLTLKMEKGELLTHTCADLAEWKRFPPGSPVVAEVTSRGKVKKLSPAQ